MRSPVSILCVSLPRSLSRSLSCSLSAFYVPHPFPLSFSPAVSVCVAVCVRFCASPRFMLLFVCTPSQIVFNLPPESRLETYVHSNYEEVQVREVLCSAHASLSS